jgi:hypothetical protein
MKPHLSIAPALKKRRRIRDAGVSLNQCSPFFRGGNPKIIVHIPRKTKRKNYKQTVVNAKRLLQYFKLPDKNSRDILWYIHNFLPYFKVVMYLFGKFRNVVLEKDGEDQLDRSCEK